MKDFYLEFLELEANEKYHNPQKNFSSYFLSFPSGARIELMHQPEFSEMIKGKGNGLGLAHFAISVGSKEKVDELTELLRSRKYSIHGKPRITVDMGITKV